MPRNTAQRFILDTTALTQRRDMEESPGKGLCKSAKELLELIARARMKLHISCHVPFPSVYEEIVQFLKNSGCSEDLLIEIDTWLVKKTPNRMEVKIPSEVFYLYIQDMRERLNKGMKVGEESVFLSATEALRLSTERKKEEIIKESTGGIIKDFRAKYRNALRYGTLDSAPDLDVLILAKEMDAAVVASDEGVKKWANNLGLRFVEGSSFPKMLKEYLRHAEED